LTKKSEIESSCRKLIVRWDCYRTN